MTCTRCIFEPSEFSTRTHSTALAPCLRSFQDYIDRAPGELGEFGALAKPVDEDEWEKVQIAEIKHGRLAMLAVSGCFAQEIVTGEGPVEQLFTGNVRDTSHTALHKKICASSCASPVLGVQEFPTQSLLRSTGDYSSLASCYCYAPMTFCDDVSRLTKAVVFHILFSMHYQPESP